jgi:fructosamine-3-kinase
LLRNQLLNLTEATDELQHDTGITAEPAEAVAVSGGSISRAYRVPSSRGPLFVKLNHATDVEMFEAEVDGLEALRGADSLAIPAVYSVGRVNETAYLFLEWLDLESKSTPAEMALGRGLARQHPWPRETGYRVQDERQASSFSPDSTDSSTVTCRRRRCCMEICGRVTGAQRRPRSRTSSTRPSILATVRRILR